MILPYVYTSKEWHRQKDELYKNSDMIEPSFDEKHKLREDWFEYPEYCEEGEIDIDPWEVHHLVAATNTHTVVQFYSHNNSYVVPIPMRELKQLILQEQEKDSNL